MADPATNEIFGVKVWALVAGFFGAVVSLSFIQNLTRKQAIATVGSGVVSSAYLTPICAEYLSVPQTIQNGLAFIVGLCAMSILGGLIKIASGFRDDPVAFLRRRGDTDGKG